MFPSSGKTKQVYAMGCAGSKGLGARKCLDSQFPDEELVEALLDLQKGRFAWAEEAEVTCPSL